MIYKEKANKTYISLGLNLGRKEDIIKVFHWINSKDMISKIKTFISSPSSATMLFVYKS